MDSTKEEKWTSGQVRRGTMGAMENMVFVVLFHAWNDVWRVRDCAGSEWQASAGPASELLESDVTLLSGKIPRSIIRHKITCRTCNWTGNPGWSLRADGTVACQVCGGEVILSGWRLDPNTDAIAEDQNEDRQSAMTPFRVFVSEDREGFVAKIGYESCGSQLDHIRGHGKTRDEAVGAVRAAAMRDLADRLDSGGYVPAAIDRLFTLPG